MAKQKKEMKARGAVIRKFREAVHLDLADFATRAKISVPMLSKFERGNRNVSTKAWACVLEAMSKRIAEGSARRSAWVAKAQEIATKLGAAVAQSLRSPTPDERLHAYDLMDIAEDNYDEKCTKRDLFEMFRDVLQIGQQVTYDNAKFRAMERLRDMAEGKIDPIPLVAALEAHIEKLEVEAVNMPRLKEEIADLRRLCGLRMEAVVKTEEADTLQGQLERRKREDEE
jgi:transcriptional regulator with XRE-family HTH domain